jgi:hypothetical protein
MVRVGHGYQCKTIIGSNLSSLTKITEALWQDFINKLTFSQYEVGNPAMTHKSEALLGSGLLNLTGKNRLDYLHKSEKNNKVDRNLLRKY